MLNAACVQADCQMSRSTTVPFHNSLKLFFQYYLLFI